MIAENFDVRTLIYGTSVVLRILKDENLFESIKEFNTLIDLFSNVEIITFTLDNLKLHQLTETSN